MAENLDVITAGETMVLGVPPRPGRLRHATSLELKIGGAESNLAIALSRLGLSAGSATTSLANSCLTVSAPKGWTHHRCAG